MELQPFLAALKPLFEATDYLGTPFSPEEKKTLQDCIVAHDARCLFIVNISPEAMGMSWHARKVYRERLRETE